MFYSKTILLHRHTFYLTSQFKCGDFSKLPSNILEMSIYNWGRGLENADVIRGGR